MKKVLISILIFVMLSTVVVADHEISDNYISQFLTNSTGQNEVVGDFTTPTSFFLQPPANETWHLSRLLITIEDTGSFDAGKYGNNIGLTNGIVLRTNISGVITNLTNGEPVLTNIDWAKFCYDVEVHTFGLGNEFLTVRWTFAKAETVIELNGANNDRIEIIVNDDFTGLVNQHFLIQGHIKQSEDSSMAIALMLGFGILGLLIFGIQKTLDDTHWILKIFLTIVMPLIFLMMGSLGLTIGAGTSYSNTAKSFYTFALNFMRVFYAYLLIALIYWAGKSMKAKKEKGE